MASQISSGPLTRSAKIRARLNHPIIDSDGHSFEIESMYLDYLKSVAGPRTVERFKTIFFDTILDPRWRTFSTEERRQRRNIRPTWRAIPAENTGDLATVMFPKLLYERLDQMGLDFSVVYTTIGFITIGIDDEEIRRAANRALNRMKADLFREFSSRLTPAAVIPMHTPGEAIEELEYAVNELGLKAAMVASYVKRPVPVIAKKYPEAGQYAYWMDTYGLDSEYNYDPFWAKCVELRITPTFHSLGYGWGTRSSISNYLHNHLGNFAASADAICRGLFLGGVPKRFPSLKFAFLEGGVAWAQALYCDLIGHWRKRNRAALEKYNPARIDRAQFAELTRRYGGTLLADKGSEIVDRVVARMSAGEDPELIDEWAPSGIGSEEELRDLFVNRFYFGCEGDDPINTLAFKAIGSEYGTKLNALFGSDIGHWDVPDLDRVAEEAYELVENELLTQEDLRDFVFVNPVRFWASTNRDFFAGTAVEEQAKKLLAGSEEKPRG